MAYAVAQANNHATSEAAALFIGGSWLAANGSRAGESLVRRGRQHLEKQVARLVEEDGSFSQYSLNYHRVLLDTLSRSEEHTSELQSLMRNSYAVFCLKKKNTNMILDDTYIEPRRTHQDYNS